MIAVVLNLQIHFHVCTQQFQTMEFYTERETHPPQVFYETSNHFDAETNKDDEMPKER
jgi:hypothetical protein